MEILISLCGGVTGPWVPPDELLCDSRIDDAKFLKEVVTQLWVEWRDGDKPFGFFVWLVIEKGWKKVPEPLMVQIEQQDI
tara:strand:- start:447 stop:686 length:240 start_codon:yes stop_codon:yes gene_type:complete